MTPSNATIEAVVASTKPTTPRTHGLPNLKALRVQALRRQLDDAVAAASTPEEHAAARKLKREVDRVETAFVLDFMKLVRKQVADARDATRGNIPKDIPVDECMAAAWVGLTVALREWEPARCCFTHVAHIKIWGELNRLVRDHKIIRGRGSYDDVHSSLSVDNCGGVVGGYQIIGGVPPTAEKDHLSTREGTAKAPRRPRRAA